MVGRVMEPISVSWPAFKQFLSQITTGLKYVDADNEYLLHAFDGPYCLSCNIAKDNAADQLDFEANYKDSGNQPLLQSVTTVTTQYELNNKYLSMAKVKINIAANTGQLRLKVPGTFGEPGAGRYIAGGDAWMDVYDKDDYLLLDVYDDDRLIAWAIALEFNPAATAPLADADIQQMGTIPGIGDMPAYPLVGTYNDSQLPDANQGWYFWPLAMGGGNAPAAEIEFEPIAGYGFLPAGLYIVITVNRPNVATGVFKGNLFWGAGAPLDVPL